MVFSLFLIAGILFVRAGGPVLISIGTSFIAGALISLATLLIDQIRNSEQMRAADLVKAGLLEAHERRDLPEYDGLVRRAEEIDVAGYTLRSFSETNEQILRQRAASGKPIKVRVLVVDPQCEAAAVMENAEHLPHGTYQAVLTGLRAKLEDIEGVEIRTVRHHLPMMIYRIDKILYTGPFPLDGTSRMALTLKLGLGGWLFQRQRAEFDALWAQAAAALPNGPELNAK
jgi:hypothetical protein